MSARLIAVVSACLLLLGLAAAPAGADEAAAIYDPSTVNVIEMTLPEAEIQKLEADPFTYVKGGTVTFTPTDGTPPPGGKGTPTHSFSNVEIKLKGKPQGSFEDLGGKAAFKLKFKKAEPFFGLRKLTLNNMTQDPSMVHETLAYTAFRAAGVPASRSGYSYVWLNGENYGLHLNLESLDTVSLPKIFGTEFDDEAQHLYEANEYGADFYPGAEPRFEVDEGPDETPADTADLTALIDAVDAAAPTGAIPPSLAALVDLGQMTRMWGVEKYIGHWDGYAGVGIPGQEGFNDHRPNNYYLYSDLSGRFQMLPWGTDQAWDVGDTGGVPMPFDGQDGRLFDLCLEDDDCAGLFSTGVANALGAIEPLELDAVAAETAALLKPWQALEAAPRKPFSSGQIAAAVSATCEFVLDRPAEAEEWLEGHPPPGGFVPPADATRGPPCTQRVVPPTPIPPSEPDSTPQQGGAPTTGGGRSGGMVKLPLPPGERHVSFRRTKLIGGAIRTHIDLTAEGTLSLLVKVRRGEGAAAICGDRVEAAGPGASVLRCQLPDWVRQRIDDHSLRFTLIVRFTRTGDIPQALVRQVTLPRQ
ncbi:MAG TPA: CotH kinase family protein [Solirubrobacterales bacterium]|nr:CotH kinase family protein [Solirubrobacterales bacterium]